MSNKQRSAGVNPVQIEQSENLAVKRVSVAAAKAIAQARAAKGLTQKVEKLSLFSILIFMAPLQGLSHQS
jgi:hypothetical protein